MSSAQSTLACKETKRENIIRVRRVCGSVWCVRKEEFLKTESVGQIIGTFSWIHNFIKLMDEHCSENPDNSNIYIYVIVKCNCSCRKELIGICCYGRRPEASSRLLFPASLSKTSISFPSHSATLPGWDLELHPVLSGVTGFKPNNWHRHSNTTVIDVWRFPGNKNDSAPESTRHRGWNKV